MLRHIEQIRDLARDNVIRPARTADPRAWPEGPIPTHAQTDAPRVTSLRSVACAIVTPRRKRGSSAACSSPTLTAPETRRDH
jgi:hypothetical protein